MRRIHRKRFEIERQPRFLTFSCYRQLPLFNNDAIKQAFVNRLAETRAELKFKLLAWVIMPEHVHLLIVPDLPASSISTVLRSLKQSVSQRVVNRWTELNAPVLPRITDARGIRRFWQRGGGYDRNIVTDEEFLEKFSYIHDNPVRRGLVTSATDWPWSSAWWYAGERDGVLEIDSL